MNESRGPAWSPVPWEVSGYFSAPVGTGGPPAYEKDYSVQLSVTNFQNGTARLQYTPKVAGKETLLTVQLNGEHISGSPFSVFVADGPLDGSTSMATGDGLWGATAGEIAEFTVQARDVWANVRTDEGDGAAVYSDGRLDYARKADAEDPGTHDTFNVSLKLLSAVSSVDTPSHQGSNYRGCAGGGSISSPQCQGEETEFVGVATYLGDGKHLVRYNVTARGVYNLTIKADSNTPDLASSEMHTGDMMEVLGSPFTPYVSPAAASAVYSNIWGQGLHDHVAGWDQRLWVQTVDIFGNNLTSGAFCAVVVGVVVVVVVVVMGVGTFVLCEFGMKEGMNEGTKERRKE